MERSSFYYPETSNTLQRARNLVQSKRSAPWSVILNGNLPLPPNPYLSYVPHDSFDDEGFLKSEALNATDQGQVQGVQGQVQSVQGQPDQAEMIRMSEELAKEQAKRMQRAMFEQALNEVANEILDELVVEQAVHAGQETISSIKAINESLDQIQSEVLLERITVISKDVMKQARNEEIQRRLDKEAKSAASEDIQNELIEEVVAKYVHEIATQEMSKVQTLNKTLNMCPEVIENLINDTIKEMIGPQLDIVVDEAIREREDKIQALKQRQVLVRKRKFFSSWLRYVRKRKSQRSILKKFPCLPSALSIKDQFKSDLKSFSLKNTLKLKKDVDNLHNVIELEDKIVEDSILEPFNDLPDVLGENGLKQWKVLVFGQSLEFDSIGKGLVEVVKKKLNIAFSSDQDQDPNVLSCFSTPQASVSYIMNLISYRSPHP